MKVSRRLLPIVLGLLLIGGGAALGLLYGPTVDYDGLLGDSSRTCPAPFRFSEDAPTAADVEASNREYDGLGTSTANRQSACADAVGPLRLVAAGLILLGLVVLVAALVLGRRRRRRAAAAASAVPSGPQIGVPPPPQRAPVHG